MSRLCRLKTANLGEDGKWAYEEIIKLRQQRVELLAALIAAASLAPHGSAVKRLLDDAIEPKKGGAPCP